MPDDDHADYLLEDATDRRDALAAATHLASADKPHQAPWHREGEDANADWLTLADRAYAWLRSRRSLRLPASS